MRPAVFEDRLVGLRIRMDALRTMPFGTDGAEKADAHLLWIVDSERCLDCWTTGLAAWNALGADSSLRRRVVVVGSGKVPAVARHALGGGITEMDRSELDSVFGPLLADTKVLLDGKGVVLLADSRDMRSECGWSFEAQVGALRGVLASELIRN